MQTHREFLPVMIKYREVMRLRFVALLFFSHSAQQISDEMGFVLFSCRAHGTSAKYYQLQMPA